ncbi:MOSC domain-containing protein [Parahaliea maris]|uniref:MOSC domain-containing protein n=1 Tax=Parahaliea maris TaxID=2716870 RepID=A0A5C9A2L0_9GAMM|nr:MOSC domain-containing protein [Parahaliea maris]
MLESIHIYPLKSCGGIALGEVDLDRFGPVGDRRWMVVEPSGQFLSQRQVPAMALLGVRVESCGGLLLTREGSVCEVPVPGAGALALEVTVWSDRVPALDAGDAAATWLTRALGRPCRLVYMADETRRPVDLDYALRGETVSFADGFPLLLISAASLAELNNRLAQNGHPAVPMNRFRPNLVVSGCGPFAEDGWRRIRIGGVELQVAKPCARCAIPAIDQSSGERDPYINRALAAFRRFDGQILFGQNLLYQQGGTIGVGDPVEVLE